MEEKALSVWRGMTKRCHKPSSSAYDKYGAKGIWVCDRWRFGENGETGFDCFLEDVGLPPSEDYHLHRIDNNRGYFKDNVGWVPKRVHGLIHGTVAKIYHGTMGDIVEVDAKDEAIASAVKKVYEYAWREYLYDLDNYFKEQQ